MTAFEFLSVALSFVLGLAVTLLLTSLLDAFRARRSTNMDWLPFVWAGYTMLWQFQYWWAIYLANAAPRWTVAMFSMLLLLAALLFLAGGLVLPRGASGYPSDLRAWFDVDGRWGVVALSVYMVAAVFVNVTLFGESAADRANLAAVGLAVTGGGLAAARSRTARVTLTLVFGILTLITLVWATPTAY